MATITGANYDEDKYRTRITEPVDNSLQGNVTVTLRVPPIGQENFIVNQRVVVIRTCGGGTQKMNGTISQVFGPSKYSINNLQ